MVAPVSPIYPTMTGRDYTKERPLPRPKAVRAKCLECQCGNAAEVRRCSVVDCALYPWRMGTLAAGKKVAYALQSEDNDDEG